MAMGLWGLLTSMMTGASSSTNHKHLRRKEGDLWLGVDHRPPAGFVSALDAHMT